MSIDPLAFMSHDRDRDRMYACIASWIPSAADVLDVGCGAGAFVEFAGAQGHSARGLDSDAENVRRAQAKGLDVRIGDAMASSEGIEGDLGAVSLIHLIEHFAPGEAAQLVAASAERLGPGGRLIIVTPNFADWSVASHIFWLDPTHVRPYPLPLISQYMMSSGLKVIHGSTQQLVRLGKRRALARPIGRLRFGREFERSNLVVVAEKPSQLP